MMMFYETMEAFGALGSFIGAEISSAVAMGMYVFLALGMMTIAKRRGIEKHWFAWIPIVNALLLGRIADDYNEKVLGQKTNLGKKCMISEIVAVAVVLVFTFTMIGLAMAAMIIGDRGYTIGFAVVIVLMLIVMMVPLVICAVFEYMSLYKLFQSCDKKHWVTYFVLGLIFGIGSIFVFVCRNKDEGYVTQQAQVIEEN